AVGTKGLVAGPPAGGRLTSEPLVATNRRSVAPALARRGAPRYPATDYHMSDTGKASAWMSASVHVAKDKCIVRQRSLDAHSCCQPGRKARVGLIDEGSNVMDRRGEGGGQ